jgi:hypothetical protein
LSDSTAASNSFSSLSKLMLSSNRETIFANFAIHVKSQRCHRRNQQRVLTEPPSLGILWTTMRTEFNTRHDNTHQCGWHRLISRSNLRFSRSVRGIKWTYMSSMGITFCDWSGVSSLYRRYKVEASAYTYVSNIRKNACWSASRCKW